MMGSSKEEIDFWLKRSGNDCWYNEQLLSEGPQHEVEITQPFYLGQTDVTVGQFRQFVQATGYQTQAEREGGAVRDFRMENSRRRNTNWLNPGFAQTDDHPVVCVSWNDAVEFCQLVQQARREKLTACPRRPSGSIVAGPDRRADGLSATTRASCWITQGSSATHRDHTWPVAGLKENAWGLYDMHGNVFAVVSGLVRCRIITRPVPRKTHPAQTAGTERVLRGGSWCLLPGAMSLGVPRQEHSRRPGATTTAFVSC